jgi:thymidylate synthase (FAD)
MGDDTTVVNAARVSFNKRITELNWSDVSLINYLSKHNHFTPFTHCVVTLLEKVPIFVARQRFKHTVGFTYNEVSRRYVSSSPEFFIPTKWRGKADNVKQGSSDKIVDPDFNIKAYHLYVEQQYQILITKGVCPEQARMVLPQSMYTEYYVTGSLAAWARAYKLRSEATAQKEIQELANMWQIEIEKLYPYSWEALIK